MWDDLIAACSRRVQAALRLFAQAAIHEMSSNK
jgi:hypothetical protein